MPLEILEWLYAQGVPFTPDNCHEAAAQGYIDVLKWFRARGATWVPEKVMSRAASSGNLEMVKWLRESEGIKWTKKTSKEAAKSRSLEVLKYVLENGCPYDEKEITDCCAGNLNPPEMLRWAVEEKKFAWDASTLVSAIASGNIDTICWALRHGCPVDRDLLVSELIKSTDTQLLRFLMDELKLEFSEPELSELVKNSFTYHNLQVFNFLRGRGYTLNKYRRDMRESPDPRIRQLGQQMAAESGGWGAVEKKGGKEEEDEEELASYEGTELWF
jgi:hypothetical protein